MESSPKFWKVLDKTRLLLVLMEELAGNAHVSFEGDLRNSSLLSMTGACQEPSATLRRNTSWPKQDFVIVPLEPYMGKKIISAIGGSVPKAIIHVQIEKDGLLQFGAYDNFQPECIHFGAAIKQGTMESLISEGIIRPFSQRRRRRPIGGRTSK